MLARTIISAILGACLVAAWARPAHAAPIVAEPQGAITGTILMVHAGGWLGDDPRAQELLSEDPGRQLVQRGWRTVSVGYGAGQGGLQDVLDAAGDELRRPTGGLLCIYGESAGAHLALVAAARLKAIDCVVAVGAPTDFDLYLQEVAVSADPRMKLVGYQINDVFGTSLSDRAAWEPARIAASIQADTLLMRQADDEMVTLTHVQRFVAARPTTQFVELQAGNPSLPEERWLHGTRSPAGRASYDAALGSFLDRAVAAHRAEKQARRRGCSAVTRRLADVGGDAVTRALRCLARRESQLPRARRATQRLRLRGEVNAARAWAALRATRTGRTMLSGLAAGRARAAWSAGDPTTIVLR